MEKSSRFVYSCTYNDYSTDLLVGSFDTICNNIERELNKADDDMFKYKYINIIDREQGISFEINDDYGMARTLYSQFIDSYYGDETL